MKRLAIVLLAIVLIACSSGDSVEQLVAQLKDSDPEVRNSAAWELAIRGDEARNAVYPLSRLLYDDNDDVRLVASFALRKIGTHEAIRVVAAYETRGMRS